MKIRNTLPSLTAILFLIITLASCQEDFSTLGSDIIGGQNINALFSNDNTVISYSRKLESVQTNNLPLYQLGSYNDPLYGKTKLELVAQVTLGTTDPDFGEGTVLDSVVLYIPYQSETVVENDVTSYTIDSVYGTDPINLKIYESNYFLRDFDPTTGFQERQKYFSTLGSVFETPGNIGDLIHEETVFIPDALGYVLLSPDGDDEDEDPDETLMAPGFRAKLPVTYFEDKIIAQEGSSELMNNNNFKEYFRGLYFEVDDLGTDGNIFLFDIAQANVVLYYKFEDPDTSGNDEPEFLNGVFSLGFAGNNVNLVENQLTPSIESELDDANIDIINGEETLYVRGGEGLVIIINLFGEDTDGNGVADELDLLRERKWLINEASLIFYVDQDKVTGGATEPERLLIYDAKNATVLADYGRDETISNLPAVALTGHLGVLDRGNDENGDFYKMRITHHISNLIHQDSVNVPLALVVTQNVLTGGFQEIENSLESGLELTPSASVIAHEGTALYGNNAAIEEKKLKLQIYYTEPN